MGKRSKERSKVDEVCGLPNNNSSKKHKKKRSHDDNNSETGDKVKCLNGSPEGLNDTEVQSHKKKNKAPKNLVDSPAGQHQEVIIKPKKEKEKEKIEEIIKIIGEDNNLTLDNESTNKKKKKKRKVNLEVEADAGRLQEPLDIAETKSCKKTKMNSPDYQIDSSEKIDSAIKKKKKIVLEIAEETVECHDAADVDKTKTKKKKKKHQSLENHHKEIQENCIDNLNQNEESTTKDKKKRKNKDTNSELSVDSGLNKVKSVTAKFNAEEAAVTEEEINQFCDEIDEEDNKQYEEWVQLLETMLGPKKHVDKET